MISCASCGRDLPERASFCPQCGAPARPIDQVQSSRPAPPVVPSASQPPAASPLAPPPAGLQQTAMQGGGSGVPPKPPNSFVDFLAFRRMVTPVVIQIVFWLAEVLNVIIWIDFIDRTGRTVSYFGQSGLNGAVVLLGILLMLISALGIRIYLEVLAVIFRINENVFSIRRRLESR